MSRQEKPAEGFQRVTVDMPKSLYDKLRGLSFTSRDSMNKIVVALVSDGIERYTETRTASGASMTPETNAEKP